MIEISHVPLVQYRPLTMWFGSQTLFQRLSSEGISDFPPLERRMVSGRVIGGVTLSQFSHSNRYREDEPYALLCMDDRFMGLWY